MTRRANPIGQRVLDSCRTPQTLEQLRQALADPQDPNAARSVAMAVNNLVRHGRLTNVNAGTKDRSMYHAIGTYAHRVERVSDELRRLDFASLQAAWMGCR